MISNKILAQQLDFKYIYGVGSEKMYGNNSGFGFSYNHFIGTKSRMGFTIAKLVCNTHYDDIRGSLSDGVSYYIRQITPNNSRFFVKINYSYSLINNAKSSLYLGSEASLNYYRIDEKYRQFANGNLLENESKTNLTKDNRWGFGVLLEYELKEIISKRVSSYISLNQELSSFEKSGLDGSSNPSLITWSNCSWGIRYKLAKD